METGNLKNTRSGYRVDRNTPLGNPFDMGRKEQLRPSVIAGFGKYLYLIVDEGLEPRQAVDRVLSHLNLKVSPTWKAPDRETFLAELSKVVQLRPKKLLCWCHPKECHADVIIGYVNGISDNQSGGV